MENKQFVLVAVIVMTIVAVGLVAIPGLSEQVYAGNPGSVVKNKGQQGEDSSKGKRQGQGGGVECRIRCL